MDKEVYIGSAKVLSNIVEDGIVSYTLDNGREDKATLAQFTAMCQEQPYDDGKISINKWRQTIEMIIQRLMEDNAEFQDVGWVLDRVSETVGQNANAATAKMFGVPVKEKITLRQVDQILKATN